MIKPVRNNLIIELHVPDLEAAKDFYSKLGFSTNIYDDPNEEELGYMTMTLRSTSGNTMLNFYGGDGRVYNQSYFKQFPKDTKRGYATGITIPVDNIESIYDLAKTNLSNSIVRELKELQDRNLSWKDFRMVDPFGFYIKFTELVDWGQK
jgi:predicted lactoylglutathione lyase